MERRIALVRDYDQLMEAIRSIVARREIPCREIDRLALFASGHAGKLLGPAEVKGLGRTSLGPMLQVLGLGLVVVEFPEEVAKLDQRYDHRDGKRVRSGIIRRRFGPAVERQIMREMGWRGRAKGLTMLSAQQRQEVARTAARARWRRKRRKH